MRVIRRLASLALLTLATDPWARTMVHLALASNLDEVLTNIRNWIIGIAALIATVCFSIGGLRLLVNGANPGEVEKAKAAFRAGGWGFGIAMLAPVIVAILKTFVGDR